MGKSSLLIAVGRLVVEESGLILFDPLGDTTRALREELSAATKARMTWIQSGAAVGLNALEGIGGTSGDGEAGRERQLNDLVHSLRRVRSGRYADSGFWGPRLEEMLTRALRAAAALPGGTLVDAHALLASGGRGFRTIPGDAIEAVRELGDRIRSRPEDADGARRLLDEVTRSPILVRMLCDRQPSLRRRTSSPRVGVVLIAGDAATVGESTARYLLSVYLALVWSELLSRPEGGKTFVMLDEAQWFVHESVAEMLRLGRRRNVHVVLATQAIAVVPGPVAEAVWTNVADFVSFRGSPEEAREFARATRGVSPRRSCRSRVGRRSSSWGRGIRSTGSVRLGCPVRVPEPRGFRPLRSPRRSKARPSPKRRRPGTRTANPPNRERTPGGPRTCWPRLCVTSTERGTDSRCESPSPISVGSSTRPGRRCEPLEGSSVVPVRSSEPGEMSWDRVGGSTLRESPQSKSAPSRTLACPVRAQHNALRLRAARFPRWKPPQSRFQHRQRRRGP